MLKSSSGLRGGEEEERGERKIERKIEREKKREKNARSAIEATDVNA